MLAFDAALGQQYGLSQEQRKSSVCGFQAMAMRSFTCVASFPFCRNWKWKSGPPRLVSNVIPCTCLILSTKLLNFVLYSRQNALCLFSLPKVSVWFLCVAENAVLNKRCPNTLACTAIRHSRTHSGPESATIEADSTSRMSSCGLIHSKVRESCLPGVRRNAAT